MSAHADAALEAALALHRAGRLEEAAAGYQAILDEDPRNASAQHLLGVVALQRGRHEEAVSLIRGAIAARPDNAPYYNNLGNALRGLQRDEEAVAAYRQAVQADPRFLDAHVNLGAALRALGRLEEARAVLERARPLGPRHAPLLNNLANVADAQGEPQRAIELYRKAVEADPGFGDAALNLGRAYVRQEQFELALPLLERGAAAAPRDADAATHYGNALLALKRNDEAQAAYRRALEIQPRNAVALMNTGIVELERGRYEDAERCLRQALEADPRLHGVRNGLGVCATALGRYEESLARFEDELRLDPDDADAHMNIGLMRLLLGRLAEAWPEYEHRLRRRNFNKASGPRWQGEALGTASLLVFPEQGAGDNMQFIRYLPRIRAEHPGARIVYPVPGHLRRLFAPALEAWGVEMPPFEGDVQVTGFQVPLLSLPGVFGTTLETVPAEVPYLRAAEAEVAGWTRRLQDRPGLKVGLVWGGNPEYRMDRHRSLPMAEVVRLLDAKDVCFVSLQKGPTSESDAPLRDSGRRLLDWMAEIDDFAQTAALIEALDLVISVDTSVAHLAGALGKPVWLANRFSSDWRWMLERADSPWYPTMRIFRQPALGDWASVVDALRRALEEEARRGR